MKLSELEKIIEGVVKKVNKYPESRKRMFLNNIEEFTSNFKTEYGLPDYDVLYIRQQIKKRCQ